MGIRTLQNYLILACLLLLAGCAKVEIQGLEEIPDHARSITNPETGIGAVYYAYWTKKENGLQSEKNYLKINSEECELNGKIDIFFNLAAVNPGNVPFRISWMMEVDFLDDAELPYTYSHCAYSGNTGQKNISMKLPADRPAKIKFYYEIKDGEDDPLLYLGDLVVTKK